MQIHIQGSRRPQPASARTIYCDGAHDAAFRPGIDLELSHWVPNLTPARYKADTSTEICLRFVAERERERDFVQRERDFELALNNHVDIDGLLALFVLAHPEPALAHRSVLVQAAEMGDFQGWGEGVAQRLYQALALLLGAARAREADPLDTCERAFAIVHDALAGAPLPQADAGLAALARALKLLRSDAIERVALAPRLVHWRVPLHVAQADRAAALAVPRFDADLAAPVLLLPQARAQRDAQSLQLVSVQDERGWFHDLHYPGYSWADTPDRWRAPGLVPDPAHERMRLDHAPLSAAAAQLNALERHAGRWEVAESMSVFGGLPGRGFPVVLSLLHEGQAAPSVLGPSQVAELLAPVVTDAR